jgi:hypothetical protein
MYLRTVDPDLLMILGQQPLQNPMAPQEPPMPGGPMPSDVMQQPGGLPQGGEQMTGAPASLPSPATPPNDFKQLPTQAIDMLPQS